MRPAKSLPWGRRKQTQTQAHSGGRANLFRWGSNLGESCHHLLYGALGAWQHSKKMEKGFWAASWVFFHSLFICFCFPCSVRTVLDGIQRHDEQRRSVYQVDFIPQSLDACKQCCSSPLPFWCQAVSMLRKTVDVLLYLDKNSVLKYNCSHYTVYSYFQ